MQENFGGDEYAFDLWFLIDVMFDVAIQPGRDNILV